MWTEIGIVAIANVLGAMTGAGETGAGIARIGHGTEEGEGGEMTGVPACGVIADS